MQVRVRENPYESQYTYKYIVESKRWFNFEWQHEASFESLQKALRTAELIKNPNIYVI